MGKPFTLSRQQVRELDRLATEELGIPSILLMESAGRGIAEFILSHSLHGKIVICCGKGNNAGDGFVVARYLDNHNISAHILLFADPIELKGDAKINYEIAVKTALSITIVTEECLDVVIAKELVNADWIVDALFGTGLQGFPHSFYYNTIEAINKSSANIIAIDIPSGLDCDTGKPLGIAIKATYTLTIAGLKKGFINPEAKEFLGEIYVVDIGIKKLLGS